MPLKKPENFIPKMSKEMEQLRAENVRIMGNVDVQRAEIAKPQAEIAKSKSGEPSSKDLSDMMYDDVSSTSILDHNDSECARIDVKPFAVLSKFVSYCIPFASFNDQDVSIIKFG